MTATLSQPMTATIERIRENDVTPFRNSVTNTTTPTAILSRVAVHALVQRWQLGDLWIKETGMFEEAVQNVEQADVPAVETTASTELAGAALAAQEPIDGAALTTAEGTTAVEREAASRSGHPQLTLVPAPAEEMDQDAEPVTSPPAETVAAPAPAHSGNPCQTLTWIDGWLARHPEFKPQAQRLARLHNRGHRNALACGAMAVRMLRRYDRELNPGKLALALTEVTGTHFSREIINNYRDGYPSSLTR